LISRGKNHNEPVPEEKIRLQLFLARCGIASRRRCVEIINQGKVTVNRVIIKEPYFKVNPDTDKVEYLDEEVKLPKYAFHKLYKPVGYLTTMRDERGRKTITELIPSKFGRLFPVGRLDLNSEGLIIFTNHGEAANRMMHPRHHVMKIYHVKLDKTPDPKDLREMSAGIELDGEKTMPAVYEMLRKDSKIIRVELMEGKKRQIRRVFNALGYKVVSLKRVAIGPIPLGNLKPGELRPFTLKEIFDLLDALGLPSF